MPSDRKRPSYRARSRRRYRIKERLNLGGEYTEADGTVWKYRSDLIDTEHSAPVQVGERIWGDLEAALDAEAK